MKVRGSIWDVACGDDLTRFHDRIHVRIAVLWAAHYISASLVDGIECDMKGLVYDKCKDAARNCITRIRVNRGKRANPKASGIT